jgi:hypothetical protein
MNFSEPVGDHNVIDFRPPDTNDRHPFEEEQAAPVIEPAIEHESEKDFGFEPQSEEPQIVAESVSPAGISNNAFEDTEPLEIPAGSSLPPSDDGLEEEIIALSGSQPSAPQKPLPDGISPEFVDAVARKVIEKISENVIRQLAWQVVPQIAESVLRDKTADRSNQ